MKSALTAVLAIHIAFSRPTEDRDAKIIKYGNSVDGYGNYRYGYETSNGIKHEQNVTFKNTEIGDVILNVKGFFSFIAGDSSLNKVHYVADENGFRAHFTMELKQDGPSLQKDYAVLQPLNSNGKLGGGKTEYKDTDGVIITNRNSSKSMSGSRSNESGFSNIKETPKSPDSNGSLKGNRTADEKEDVILQPLISKSSLDGKNITNGETGGISVTNQNSTNEMKSNSELRIEEKVAPQLSISNNNVNNNQIKDQNIIPGSKVNENVSLQPQISNYSNSSLEENETKDTQHAEIRFEGQIENRIGVNAMKTILGGRKK